MSKDPSGAREALELLAIAATPEDLDWAINAALNDRGKPYGGAGATDAHLQLLAVRERLERLGGRWAR